MSVVAGIFRPRSSKAFAEPFWADFVRSTRSGRSVTAATALEVMVVFACLRVLAEGVAQVPLKLFQERADGGRDVAKTHPLHHVLHRRPNPWQTSFEFRESLLFHTALAGNFFAFKNRVKGRITELIPFEPGAVSVERDPATAALTYSITSPAGEKKNFPAETIWHVRGPSWNTWMGLPAVELAREAIGLAMATEEAHARLHANGAQASGLYSVEGTLTAEQYKSLREWIERSIAGENRFKPFILDRAAKWTQMTMNGVDAQHLETRKHQVEEICRAFRVMPIMIGQADKAATYASAEQMFLAHVVHTLTPWYERIEQSIDVKLLSREDAERGIYAKFLPNGLMRGAAKDRAEFYWKMWQMGSMNANEIRALEEMNPYDGGEEFHIPGNMAPAEEGESSGILDIRRMAKQVRS